mgnify:CR=1 FL=1
MMKQDMEEAMEQKNRIAAVVVTYNRKELLRECITALLAQSMKQLDILLHDCSEEDIEVLLPICEAAINALKARKKIAIR